jgi:hypothetical protein
MTVSDRIWPLAIVGRGSTAAYYLTSIDPTPYAAILAVGEDDAWAGKRGYAGNATDPTLRINHPLHLIAHFKETIPGFSTRLVDRREWAGMNKAVLEGCRVRIHQATVTNITEVEIPLLVGIEGDLGPFGFQIDLKGPDGSTDVAYAYKVVVCAGTGGHRVPQPLAAARKNFASQVLDLDEFAGLGPDQLDAQIRVVVVGGNAAIDAVHKALNYHCKIDWLIDAQQPWPPPMLKTQPNMLKAWDNKDLPAHHPNSPRLTVHRYDSFKYLDVSGRMLRLQVMPTGSTIAQYAMGNYIAYGVGPDGASTGMIGKAIQAKLKPILDRTRATTSDPLNPPPRLPVKPEAILGYEAEGTGLRTGFEVFGAMSGQIGRAINGANDRLGVLAAQIEEYRRIYQVYMMITNAGFPKGAKPFFARSPAYLATLPRPALHAQLQMELKYLTTVYHTKIARPVLEVLANQILAYHTAATYKSLGDANDPYALKNFKDLLDRVTTNLPKGAVGDHGQLTSISRHLAPTRP